MAQKTRTDVQNTINANLPDNNSNLISPADTRGTQTDLNDSSFNILTDDSDDITQGSSNLFLTVAQAVLIATAEQTANKGAANGYASLDSSGLLPATQLPPLAISEYLGAVADEPAMLALVGQRGDWCTRLDTGTNFQIIAEPSNVIGNWLELSYPAAPVTSVNTKTGVVVIDLGDIADTATRLALTTGAQSIEGEKTFSDLATFQSNALGSRPVELITASFSVTSDERNKMVFLDISAATVITVDDTTNTDFNVGDVMELYWDTDTGSNTVEFQSGGSVNLDSKDSLLNVDGIGSAVTLIKKANNEFRLIGALA